VTAIGCGTGRRAGRSLIVVSIGLTGFFYQGLDFSSFLLGFGVCFGFDFSFSV